MATEVEFMEEAMEAEEEFDHWQKYVVVVVEVTLGSVKPERRVGGRARGPPPL